MPKYVALLRGIGPSMPNMRNDKLKEFFAGLGFTNVTTVISSGNVLFESPEKSTAKLEKLIETELPKRLGFTSSTIIRSQEELQKLFDQQPFGSAQHSSQLYLMVTFAKRPPDLEWKLPYRPENKPYKVTGLYDRALCSVVDLATAKTPDYMTWIEKQLGKEITTRTWLTVQRILKKLGPPATS
jgi:uncharacterized protein (DUF1697 family)